MPTRYNIKQTGIIAVLCLLSIATGLLILTNTKFAQLIFYFTNAILSKNIDQLFWKHGMNSAAIDLIIAGISLWFYYCYSSITKGKIFFITSTVFVLHFYYQVIVNAVNMPLSDDFESVMVFMNKFFISDNFHEKLSLVCSQYYETRLVLFRSICLMYTLVAGEINFNSLLFISSLFILGIAYLLFKSIRLQNDHKYILFAVTVILLFQFQYHSGIFFLTGGMPKFLTLFFSIAAFYFLPKNSKLSFATSLLFSILSALSFGNGFFCFLLGFLFLLNNKTYVFAGIWGVITLLFLLWYFHGYALVLSESVSLHSITRSFFYGLIFLGNAMQFLHTINIPIITGIIIWCITILLTIKKYYKQNPTVYFTIVFILSSSLLAAPFRLHEDEGLARALMTHYGIYSMVAICCCVISLTELFASEKNLSAVLNWLIFTSLLYHFSSDLLFFPEVSVRKQNLTECVYPWLKYNPTDKAPVCSSIIADPDNAGVIIAESEKLNIYRLPDLKHE